MIPFDEIEPYTPIVIKGEKNKLKKVDSVAAVRDKKIYVSHKGNLIEIPEKRILGYQDGKIITNFLGKDTYKFFWKIQVAKIKGDKLIPEFEENFHLADSYEVYNVGWWQKICRCNLYDENIKYIIQYSYNGVFRIFAEINRKIDPNYTFVYHLKKKFFIFVPLTQTQRRLFNFSYDLFKDDWVGTILSEFSPINFVRVKFFQNALDLCGRLFPKFFKEVEKYPDYPLDGVYLSLKNCNKKLQKKCKDMDYKIHLTFDYYYKRLNRLNSALKGKLGTVLSEFEFEPSPLREAAAYLGISGAVKLKVDPFYIIPTESSTIIIILIPVQPSFKFNLFQHFHKIYKLLEVVYENL
ncbi:MAG: hypothetical protein ACTSO9_18200 [Candidatus Helarchaeota archaeon]